MSVPKQMSCLTSADPEDGPLGAFVDEVILRRIGGAPETNIAHRKVYHSPTGFEWGYGGSGPADLALNILLHFMDEGQAFRLHQAFKWEFLASMPGEGGRIPRTAIQAWVDQRLQKEG